MAAKPIETKPVPKPAPKPAATPAAKGEATMKPDTKPDTKPELGLCHALLACLGSTWPPTRCKRPSKGFRTSWARHLLGKTGAEASGKNSTWLITARLT